MRSLYTVAFLLLLPSILCRLWLRGLLNPAYRDRWQERMGVYGRALRTERPIWVHAVSVGEVNAAIPLINALRQRHPGRPLLITTITPTGSARVR